MLVASGSGGGKSYLANHYFASELRQGGEAIIMEDGNSYDKLTEVFNGVILQHDDERPFTFNPFLLDGHDVVETPTLGKGLTEGKLLYLITLLKLISGDKGNTNDPEVTNTVLEVLVTGYYSAMWSIENPIFKFDTFFEHCKAYIGSLVKTKAIPRKSFDPNV
ncbi:hypothetical protein LCGC14_1695010, partial [marine sediment metagenome]